MGWTDAELDEWVKRERRKKELRMRLNQKQRQLGIVPSPPPVFVVGILCFAFVIAMLLIYFGVL